jgi:hypothetical protein
MEAEEPKDLTPLEDAALEIAKKRVTCTICGHEPMIGIDINHIRSQYPKREERPSTQLILDMAKVYYGQHCPLQSPRYWASCASCSMEEAWCPDCNEYSGVDAWASVVCAHKLMDRVKEARGIS